MKRRWSVVSLDAGGTLMEPYPSVGHVYAESAAAVGLGAVDPAAVTRQFAAAWRRLPDGQFDYSRPAWSRLVAASFAGLVPTPDSPALFAEAYERFADAPAWRVFPEVPATLRTLREGGVRLVVTSNWDERLPRLLAALDLASYFEWVGVSRTIGFHKPDVRCYQAVTAQLGVPADEILHAGDRAPEDVDGPRQAGWSAVLIQRLPHPEPGPDTLRSLADLIPRVLPDTGLSGPR